jgi:formylglycine-generating enzyme required for sulfatase activity/class 3 adenylate cyclase
MPGQVHQFGAGRGGFDSPEGLSRRLAAIVAADIAGYSRLMGMDEEGTLARVKRHRRELIDPTIAEHHGKLIKNTGDGFLAMFDSPVEAVRCAIVIQQSMIGRNAALPKDQCILYRIGVNLGDVIVEPDDIYGDGVNIAARLENLAEPGSVYISGGIYEQIKNKLVCGYQSLGDQKVKNITDPVSVYRVLPDPAAVRTARRSRWPAGALTALAIALAGGAGGYLYTHRPAPPARQAALPAIPAPAPAPVAPALPAPQVAVLPPIQPAAPTAAVEPEMVALPGGSFAMGGNEDPSERPVHRVAIAAFAIGRYPVRVREWKACVAAKACADVASDADEAPVANVSWNDTQQFTAWLSQATHKPYRLPSEAEWEYAARGGTATQYWWGNHPQAGLANCKGCGEPYDAKEPLKAGSFLPNPFGLYDMGGGVDQWVADCFHRNYQGAPADGSPWLGGDCTAHVLRGGSWKNDPGYVRPASRNQYDTGIRYPTHGFRVAASP